MSEEVASADSLLTENAQLRRRLQAITSQIDEQQTTIGYQDVRIAKLESELGTANAEITRLEEALRQVVRMKTITGARRIVEIALRGEST